jgi:cation diffusion facilitator family transporter
LKASLSRDIRVSITGMDEESDQSMPHGIQDHPAKRGIRSTVIGILTNLILAIVKAVAGVLGNSYALIADAIESLTDVLSSLVVFLGLRMAMRPPDENHPYGHGKAEPIAAVIVSFSLVAAAITIAIKSVHEIVTPHLAPAPFTLAVLAVVVIIKEVLFRYVVNVGEHTASTAVKTDAWHHRSDAITSGLAFVGISIALAGGRGWEGADDWAALLASGIILYNAAQLARPAVAELTDEVPAIDLLDKTRAVALAVPGVAGLDKSYIRKMGFDYYLDIHVLVDGNLPVWRGHEIAHQVKDEIRRAHPQVADVLVHIEPSER